MYSLVSYETLIILNLGRTFWPLILVMKYYVSMFELLKDGSILSASVF